jgi:predicted transcriptional regulator
MNYTAIAIQAVMALVQAEPAITAGIKALLAPILEGRAPTEAEFEAAKAAVDQANQAVQAG